MKIRELIKIGVLLFLLGIGEKGVSQSIIHYPDLVITKEDQVRKQGITEWVPPVTRTSNSLPKSVDNSRLPYFPPPFTQRGNSCSQASGVGYVFTYEWNRMMKQAANRPDRLFSYHFTWNYLNEGNNEGSHPELGYDLIKKAGVATQEEMSDTSDATSSTTWMSGYDKYIRAMHHRVKAYAKIALKEKGGIERLKQYLYNKGVEGDTGGVVTFSCKSKDWVERFYNGPSETGVHTLIAKVGTTGAHALTIVGYDDTVAFDLNGDGKLSPDEEGAFIVMNTWGSSWGTGGRAYYPYKFFTLPAAEGGLAELDAMALLLEVEPHKPKLVFCIDLTYTSRNDLYFSMGAAEGRDAEKPTVTASYPLLMNQGGDHYMQGNDLSEEGKQIQVALDFTDEMNKISNFKEPTFFLTIRKIANGEVGVGEVNHFFVKNLETGVIYSSAKKQLPITGRTVISTGSPLKTTSASDVHWREGDQTLPYPLLIRGAKGVVHKALIQGYDKERKRLTIRYQLMK